MDFHTPKAAPPGGLFLLVTETFPPEINGVASTVAGYRDGLRARGAQVHVLRPRQDADEGVAPDPWTHLVPGIRIPWYPALRFGVATQRRVQRLLYELEPDAIYIATEGPLGRAALGAANMLGIPAVTGFHTRFDRYAGHYRLGPLGRMVSGYLRRFHNRAAVTLVGTGALRDELTATGHVNVVHQPRGVDTALFSPVRRDRALRAEWIADDATPVVISVGRLAAEKNIDLVVHAFAAFARIRPDARLVFVGDGPLREGLQRAHPWAVFSGVQTGERLAAHYASADILLFPSLTETFGNITVEGLASGLATVAFDHAAAHELLCHRGNGMIAPPGDAKAYLAAVIELANDEALVRAIRAQARVTAEALDMGRSHAAFHGLLLDAATA